MLQSASQVVRARAEKQRMLDHAKAAEARDAETIHKIQIALTRSRVAAYETEQRNKTDAAVREVVALRAELADVHARRERAQAEFEHEMRAREEATRARQAIDTERELARFDRDSRHVLREGQLSQSEAAEAAVGSSLASVVSQAAQTTSEAIEARVSQQVKWISDELPALLQAKADEAIRTACSNVSACGVVTLSEESKVMAVESGAGACLQRGAAASARLEPRSPLATLAPKSRLQWGGGSPVAEAASVADTVPEEEATASAPVEVAGVTAYAASEAAPAMALPPSVEQAQRLLIDAAQRAAAAPHGSAAASFELMQAAAAAVLATAQAAGANAREPPFAPPPLVYPPWMYPPQPGAAPADQVAAAWAWPPPPTWATGYRPGGPPAQQAAPGPTQPEPAAAAAMRSAPPVVDTPEPPAASADTPEPPAVLADTPEPPAVLADTLPTNAQAVPTTRARASPEQRTPAPDRTPPLADTPGSAQEAQPPAPPSTARGGSASAPRISWDSDATSSNTASDARVLLAPARQPDMLVLDNAPSPAEVPAPPTPPGPVDVLMLDDGEEPFPPAALLRPRSAPRDEPLPPRPSSTPR